MSKKQFMTLSRISVICVAICTVFLCCMLGSKADSKVNVYDPISAEYLSTYENFLTIPEVKEEMNNVTVVGQVAYAYPSKADGTINNFIIQDVVDGEIVGLLVNDDTNSAMYNVGDVVAITGSVGLYGGVKEFGSVTEVKVLKVEEKFKAQEITISELKSDAKDYISEYVVIKNAKLGVYDGKSNTLINDGTGELPIYKGASYPTDLKQGDRADVYCAFSQYKESNQLRTGLSADYVPCKKVNEENYHMDTVLDVAKFGGKATEKAYEIRGDRYNNGDYYDNVAKITVANNKECSLPGEAEGTYVVGVKGLSDNEYIQMELSTSKYGNLNISLDMKATETASRYYIVEYSIDGEEYNKYTKVDLGVKDVVKNIELELPAVLNNQDKIYIRLVPTGLDFTGASADLEGKIYLSNVVISGCPTKDASVCSFVNIMPKDNEITSGMTLDLTCDTDGAMIYYSINEGEIYVYNPENKPIIDTFPMNVSAFATKEGLKNSVEICKTYSQLKVDKVKVSPKAGVVVKGKVIKLSCDTKDATIMYSFDKNEWNKYEEGKIVADTLPMTVYAKAVKEGYEDSEITEFAYTEKVKVDYNVYFGQLHSHTNFSDGAGTPQEAYEHASKKAEQVDFMAVTDHSNSFDNADSANILDGSMSTEWLEGHNLADKYTTKDFVGLFGYEMTWSNGLGHMNTFNTPGFQSRTQSDFTKFDTALNNYYSKLKEVPGSISQFNHPGTTFGDFKDFAHYDEELDDLITIIEVGNGEGAIGSSGYFPSYEYYTRALDKGWHVAPTNNQDNHKGLWGNANTGRSVVLVESLTRENIYDAMKNYRVYSTEDNDLSIKYTLDGYTMGEIIDKDDVGKNIELVVDINDPTDKAIGKVEVIVNGGLSIASKTVSTNSEKVTFEVPSDYSYYYIKVTQEDKDIAVTAPVWVGKVEAIGSNGINTTTSLCVAGDPIDVNYGMYNNEQDDLEVKSVEYSVNDEVIHKVNLQKAGFDKIPSMGEVKYSFAYTHKKVGAVQIKVTVKGLLNGVEKIYTDILKLDYISEDMVTDILVDGTHYNDYVSGYYDGNMGNFTDLAATKNARVTVEKKAITKEMLDKANLFIVSAPAKNAGSTDNGNYEPQHYTKEFLDLVKYYVSTGKTLVVCGLSDIQDSELGQTSTEQNKLLKAIGATTRVNSDQACDDVTNGGQPYRLYLENFNLEREEFKGYVEGQKYSQYKGCSLILDSKAVEQGRVNWLVKGYETSYSQDVTNHTNDRVDTSGNIVTMAVEKLDSGSNVYISGAVWLSNFEVKASLDNASDLQYVNYTIANNMLDKIAKEMPITPIRKVRKAAKGDIFTIEGYVTSGTSDENCRFFDAIYVQDETAGLTIFPYSAEGLELGAKMQITGYVDEYQGDKEIQIMSYKILDEPKKIIEPTVISVKDSMDYDNYGGLLLKTAGRATNIKYTEDGIGVSSFDIVDDAGNAANIFIDGYILSSKTGKNELAAVVKEGQLVSAVGLLYKHPEGTSDVSVPCFRVRNCDEIVALTDSEYLDIVEDMEWKSYEGLAYDQHDDVLPNDTTNIEDINGGDGAVGETIDKTEKDDKADKLDNADTINKINSSIKTGDNNNMLLYIVIAIIALGACIVLFINRKKLNKDN